jgi:hypothetical protein
VIPSDAWDRNSAETFGHSVSAKLLFGYFRL